jgi:hypothetical protein
MGRLFCCRFIVLFSPYFIVLLPRSSVIGIDDGTYMFDLEDINLRRQVLLGI